MTLRLKPLAEQVIVITGATSGIGLATARMAAKRGARLVLASRDEEALCALCDELRQWGAEAVYVKADVGIESDVRQISKAAQRSFGGFDTWINNAGVSIFGRLLEVATDDSRRLFDTNFWGVVFGSLEAARSARRSLSGYGSAIINVGSTLSDRAIPIQGMYSASKHAVRGFTEALRMELEHDDIPISVTLIKPGSIDTQFPHHARNYMDEEPSLPGPLYHPRVVAEAILHCAEHPTRDLFVGGGGKAISAMGHFAPSTTDAVMKRTLFSQQKSGRTARHRDALYRPSTELKERGDFPRYASKSSVYTRASRNPLLTASLLAGAGLAITSLYAKEKPSTSRSPRSR